MQKYLHNYDTKHLQKKIVIKQGKNIKRCMKTVILLYQTCAIQPKRDRLHDIVRCIEMLKAIEIEFRTKRYIIN